MRWCLILWAGLLHLPADAVPVGPTEESDSDYWIKNGQRTLNSALRLQLNTNQAKNVVFFLGDGMSVPTVTAARIYQGQKANRSGEENELEFDKFPYVSLAKTYALNYQTPDSANTATAYLCGVKANYGTLGVNGRVRFEDCQTSNNTAHHVTSVLKWAQEAGKSTGFVTTTRVTHATPAGLYSHTASRDWESSSPSPACPDIALQLIHGETGRNIEVIMGGGRRAFTPSYQPDAEHVDLMGGRQDGKNLTEEWLQDKKNRNFNASYVVNLEQFNKVRPQETDFLLGLFEYSHMHQVLDKAKKADKEPTIAEMTRKAIEILRKNVNGYFLLVEGGQIDLAHHDSKPKRALEEAIAMDDAVKVAVQMTNELDTLILVTADHSHTMTIAGYPARGNNILGIADVSDIDFMTYPTLTYANGPGYTTARRNLTEAETAQDDYEALSTFPNKNESHGGDDVAVFARGPYSHLFHGVYEQSYIPHAIGYAACIGKGKLHCDGSAIVHQPASGALLSTVALAVVWITMPSVGLTLN